MKVLLYGRYGKYPEEIKSLVKSFDLKVVFKNPQVVICYGGDGTLLGAERDYPQIPKLILKNSQICHLCSTLPNDKLLEMLVSKKLKIKKFTKLEALISPKSLISLNDIIIAHKFPNTAIRFEVFGKKYIGDGVVISTPFGSTGYYYSLTKTNFTKDIGVALNNIHGLKNDFFITTKPVIIKILRGPAILASDNDPNLIDLKENQEIIIKKASQVAYLLSP